MQLNIDDIVRVIKAEIKRRFIEVHDDGPKYF
jgi:hypothetical protein